MTRCTCNKFKHTCELFNSRELAALNLTAKVYRNGAVHVFGTLEALSNLTDLTLYRGVSPAITTKATSYPVGHPEQAVEEPGYPRIELHPCHRDRINLGLMVTEPAS